MERADLVRILREVASVQPAVVVAVYLYGSRARGTARAESDVDLGVLLRVPPPPRRGGPVSDLEAAAERALALPVEAVFAAAIRKL